MCKCLAIYCQQGTDLLLFSLGGLCSNEALCHTQTVLPEQLNALMRACSTTPNTMPVSLAVLSTSTDCESVNTEPSALVESCDEGAPYDLVLVKHAKRKQEKEVTPPPPAKQCASNFIPNSRATPVATKPTTPVPTKPRSPPIIL